MNDLVETGYHRREREQLERVSRFDWLIGAFLQLRRERKPGMLFDSYESKYALRDLLDGPLRRLLGLKRDD